MGVKTARTKQVRKELRKTHKAIEVCHYCRKKCADLDAHIQAAHGHICERCGQRFATEGHWRQHMRDRHGLDEKAAIRDDCQKKIDRWMNKKGGKAKAARRARAAGAAQDGGAGAGDASMAPLEAIGSFRHVCELCGAEAMLPANLADSGLSFTCAHVGRRCGTAPAGGSAGGGASAAGAACVAHAAPAPSAIAAFAGFPPAAAPAAAAAAIAAFAGPAVAAPPAAAAPAAAASIFAAPAFLAPPGVAAPAGAAAMAIRAEDVPVPGLDSDDEDL